MGDELWRGKQTRTQTDTQTQATKYVKAKTGQAKPQNRQVATYVTYLYDCYLIQIQTQRNGAQRDHAHIRKDRQSSLLV